mmetsp:Transcript_14237/g.28406  ORF Transcript_14237/g.28406 Transcript_14237/m.28406 type:complete len:98 (+) Transcript_14237:648-941(+)
MIINSSVRFCFKKGLIGDKEVTKNEKVQEATEDLYADFFEVKLCFVLDQYREVRKNGLQEKKRLAEQPEENLEALYHQRRHKNIFRSSPKEQQVHKY